MLSPLLQLVLTARNFGPRPLSDFVAVLISVGDVNDNPPEFLEVRQC